MANLTSLIVNDTGSLILPNGTLAQRTSITPTVVNFTTVTTTSWTAPSNVTQVEVLVVAGGGGGGYASNNGLTGGGGGAGGLLYNAAYPVVPGTSYTVTVGGGGAGSTSAGSQGTNGSNSIFASLTAIGGGGGGSYQSSPYTSRTGNNGGSGGGGASNILYAPGGSGTVGQGFAGGSGTDLSGNDGSGGGGGAGGVGTAGYDTDYVSGGGGQGGQGGPGLWFNISGTPTAYAGGGGGTGSLLQGLGGVGGGGAGGTIAGSSGSNGASNTGGGGGGGSGNNGGNGGSGVVILRYSLAGTTTAQAETRFNTNTNTIENFSNNQWKIAPTTNPGFVNTDIVVDLQASRYGTGSSTWYDLSPAGNNAVLTSATLTTTGGASLQFTGSPSSAAVIANSSTLMSNQISFEIWIYFNIISTGDIMEFGVGSGSYGQYYFRISGANFEVGHSGINNTFYLDTLWPTSNISTGVWYCMSYVANTDLKYGQLFVNGSPVATASVSAQTSVSTFTPNAMNIGGYTWDGYIACNIASYKFWNKTLTPAEIRQNYNAHSQRPYFTNKGLQPEQAAIVRDPSLVFNLDSYDPQSINISNTQVLTWYDTAGGQQCALSTTSRDPWQYQNNSGLQFNVINSGENVSLQQISGLGTPTASFPFTMIAVASNTTNWTPANGTTQMIMNMNINGQRIMLGCATISSVGGLFFGGANQYQGGVNALQGGVLYHVAYVVYNASGDGRLGLYVNGEQQALTQTSASAVGGTAGWSIASNAASGEYWTGKIASIQVYNRLLTNKEIQQNYQAARQRYGLP